MPQSPMQEAQECERLRVAEFPSPKPGDLKVWWIPQVPGTPFEVRVSSLAEAKKLLEVLADYDMFQLATRIKGDYCNMGGLTVFEDGEWTDWESDNGEGIDKWEAKK